MHSYSDSRGISRHYCVSSMVVWCYDGTLDGADPLEPHPNGFRQDPSSA